MSALHLLSSPDFFLVENKLIYKDKLIGILNPGIVFEQVQDTYYVHGINGVVEITDSRNPENILVALLASQSILIGEEKSIEQVNTLLNEDITSRTTSYIVSISSSCEDVLNSVENLKKHNVLFVGCGGIGSISALIVAGCGIENISLIDFDTIERSNLNRQLLFTINDIGKYKVDVVKQCINDRFPFVRVSANKAELSKENIDKYVNSYDTVVFTADNPVGVIDHVTSHLHNICVIKTGYFLNYASIEIIEKHVNISDSKWYRVPNSIIPSFGPTNVELSGLVSSIVFHRCIGKINNTNDVQMKWVTSKFPRHIQKSFSN